MVVYLHNLHFKVHQMVYFKKKQSIFLKVLKWIPLEIRENELI